MEILFEGGGKIDPLYIKNFLAAVWAFHYTVINMKKVINQGSLQCMFYICHYLSVCYPFLHTYDVSMDAGDILIKFVFHLSLTRCVCVYTDDVNVDADDILIMVSQTGNKNECMES